jgi:hypothetical protein
MGQCLHRLRKLGGNGIALYKGGDLFKHDDIFFRCYWEMVGGAGFMPKVSHTDLISTFKKSFNDDGCPVVPQHQNLQQGKNVPLSIQD